jgi:hypothetical protein
LEPEFIEFIRNARKRKVEKFRHQLSVFSLCLVISIFLWILVHLSREYYYTTSYRLNYTQVPWNMKLVGVSDSVLVLTIRIQGYEYFSEQFYRHKERECDVSLRGLKVKYNDDGATGYLLTRGIARTIAEQGSYPLEVFATAPDTIFFTFDRRTLKRMTPVKPGNLNAFHEQKDTVRIHPDSIPGNAFKSEITKKKKISR